MFLFSQPGEPGTLGGTILRKGSGCGSQVVVLDKLDYCSSLKNLHCIKDKANFKVRQPALP